MRTPTPLLAAVACALAASACNVISSDLLGKTSDAPTQQQGPQDAGLDGGSTNFPTQMLIANYEFEDGTGTKATESARGLDGTLSDGTMWTPTGRNGKGIVMNGANPVTQFVSLPNGLLTGVDDFTISVWVKLSGNPAWARIYDIGNGLPDPANRFMYLTTSGFTNNVSDGIHASSYGGTMANESIIATQTFLPLGVWKHLAITGTGGSRKLYIDGFPAMTLDNGPAVAPREMEPIATSAWIGKSRFAADPGFPGTIDEFRVYSRVLTASEIADLAWPKADYSYWRFDESSGTAAKDSSDRALATALANGAAWTTGRQGGGVAFTGGAGDSASPHVVITGNPLAGCTNQFTIAAWIRINSYATNAKLFDFGTSTTHELSLAPNDGTGMHFAMKSPAGTFDLATTTPPIPADSTWHHVAVTMDSGNVVVMFVDGTPVKTQSSATVRVSDFATLAEAYLGRSRTHDPFFDGAIDELRIGCRALTPDEIKNLSHP